MEFDKDTPASDEARRLAESKKLILQPVHVSVAPEETEGEMVARHLASPAIANVAGDIEQDTPSIQPSESIRQKDNAPRKTHRFSFLFAILFVLALTTLGVLTYLLIK